MLALRPQYHYTCPTVHVIYIYDLDNEIELLSISEHRNVVTSVFVTRNGIICTKK